MFLIFICGRVPRYEILHEARVEAARDFLCQLALGSQLLILNLFGSMQGHGALGQPVTDDSVSLIVLDDILDGSLAIREAAGAAGNPDRSALQTAWLSVEMIVVKGVANAV